MSTILEIESAVQKLPVNQARELQDWLADYLGKAKAADRQKLTRETQSLPAAQCISDADIAAEVAASTWEKIGSAPEVDYDKL
jgi:hypothetical protein